MSSKRILSRVPAAKFITVATLSNHQLKFHKVGSKDGTGKCDAFETGYRDNIVTGVVYNISDSEKIVLDRVEGLHHGYEQKTVTVNTGDNNAIQAFTYFATDTDPSIQPFHWYKEHVMRGAMENNFPQQYIHSISQIESIADPRMDRHKKEMSIYLKPVNKYRI